MIRFALFMSFIIGSIAWSAHPVTPVRGGDSDTARPSGPGLQTAWASHSNGALSPDQVRTMLDSPIVITDKKGEAYTITRFEFSYKAKTQYKDDSTGQVNTTWHLYTRDYFNTPYIDSLWRSTIDSSLQSGETIYVNHILVKNIKGIKSMAPGLELNIQ